MNINTQSALFATCRLSYSGIDPPPDLTLCFSFTCYFLLIVYTLSLFFFLPVRTALIAIIGFMPTKGEGAIGSLDYTPEERRALAKK